MNGLAVQEPSDIHLVNQAPANGDKENTAPGQSTTSTLEQLALKLLVEAQSLNDVPTVDVRSGIDFYEEVKRFEIDLIQRALVFTRGSQVRAARLLQLKVTTLNSKIKHYVIDIDSLVGGLIPVEAGGMVHDRR